MTSHKTITGALCEKCGRFGVQEASRKKLKNGQTEITRVCYWCNDKTKKVIK